MSDKEFNSRLPHLEEGGWQPGMYWVPTAEQQDELDIRAEAEARVNNAWDLRWDLTSRLPAPPQVPTEHEEWVKNIIVSVKLERDYQNRPFDTILQHTLRWIDQLPIDPPTPGAWMRAFEREATALLRRKAEHPDESTFHPEIVDLSVRWAAIEHYMFHFHHDWDDDNGISWDDSLELIAAAGISEGELMVLLNEPMNDEARDFQEHSLSYMAYANQAIIEQRLLGWAKANDVDISAVHGAAYKNFLIGG